MPRGQKSRRASYGDSKGFLGKAVEFLEAAKWSLDQNFLAPAVGNAVHAGISGADALCAAKAGETSSSEHADAVAKVRHHDVQVARCLSRLLKMKTRAEYDPQEPSPQQAKEAVESAERLVKRVA